MRERHPTTSRNWRALLIGLSASVAACAPEKVEVCAGQGAGCVSLLLSGGPGDLDAVRLTSSDASGVLPPKSDEWNVRPVWPAEVALVLPQGSYHLLGLGYKESALAAVARADLHASGVFQRLELRFTSYPGPACDNRLLDGEETDVDCGGSACPTCALGGSCRADRDCGKPGGPVCLLGRCTLPTCDDAQRDGDETDVDCGGGCDACPNGGTCAVDSDCQSGRCSAKVCRPLDCFDGSKAGVETDVDCGGPFCTACGEGKGCLAARDCESGTCEGGHCAAPSCQDGRKNGPETDVDCGGSCPACANGRACTVDADCGSRACVASRCAPPSCQDTRKNGLETDVDCGGPCPACADGKACSNPIDCDSLVCAGARCVAAACADSVRNGDETDVDCGGKRCPSCVPGSLCAAGADCKSLVCDKGRCQVAACADKVKNGDESDLDCGGSCPACADGSRCGASADCRSAVCTQGACQVGSCMDGVRNGQETDADCGGLCPACVDGKLCGAAADCKSGVCGVGLCRVARCADKVLNNGETDVDCGGPCAPCTNGGKCVAPADCASGVCSSGSCSAPACNDKVRNAAETDVDCGGACAPCADGKACAVPGDCAAMRCEKGVCRSCGDGLKSGGETDVDCGGPLCAACPDLKACVQPVDCQSVACALGQCRSCADAAKNGDESDVDCGGSCTACADLKACVGNLDCQSGRCSGGRCVSCKDGQKNGTETDVDCGGLACDACADGKACVLVADCASRRCEGGKCASCNDGLKSGGETDIDCGGGLCVACALGKACALDRDCAGGNTCFLGKCLVPVTITSVTPPFGPSGKTTDITIVGTNFDAQATVTVGGVAGASVQWVSSSKITLTVPVIQDAFGRTPVAVKNPSGQTAQGWFYQQAQTIQFQSYLASPALPVKPTDFAPGDFDGDGKQDLVVALPTANQVAIFIGKGDGSFAAPLLFGTGNSPRGVAAGDFDGDGKLDAVSADNAANTFSLLRGDGTGKLGMPTATQVPIAPVMIEAADFNRDGKPDVVVASTGGVVLAINNGNGTFAGAVSVSVDKPAWLKLVDENRDGLVDIVCGLGGTFSTLPGKGDGTFLARKVSPSSGGSNTAFVGDLNADGLADAYASGKPHAVINPTPYRLMRGDFSGNFPNGAEDMTINSAGDLAVRQLDAADLDGDGKLELVLVGSEAEIAWARGSAKVFTTAQGFLGTGAPPIDYLLTDWDGDKKLDVLTLSDSPPRVHFHKGNGDSTFRAPFALEVDNGEDLTTGDFNGDGAIDVAQTGLVTQAWVAGKTGYAKPYFASLNPQNERGANILAGALTQSGLVDMVVYTVGSYVNTGGSFQKPVGQLSGSVVTLGDFDSDGKLDSLYYLGIPSHPLQLQRGLGAGTFAAGVQAVIDFPSGWQLASGDFDGDGKLDVVGDDRLSGWAVCRGNGDGTLAPRTNVTIGTPPTGVTTADVDGDGKLDLLGALGATQELAVALGNGDGTFKLLAPVKLPATPVSRLGMGDLDGDNRPDVVLVTSAASAVVLLNKGAGVFVVAAEVAVGPAFERAAISDLNGDGKADLVLATGGANFSTATYLLLNQSK